MNCAIQIVNLSKRFPRTGGYKDILTFWRRDHVTALSGIDVSVRKREIFGLVGPNGAGKTTLLKILAGLILPDDGRLVVDGIEMDEHRRKFKGRLTYISGDERSLYWRLTGQQNLRFFAVLNEVPKAQVVARVNEVLDLVGLRDAADERVAKYSSGMRQRLSIARGLVADPDILLLDEPTRSLDPLSARRLWAFIREDLVEKRGKTVVMATHNMDEATHLCDHVAIICGGRVRAFGTVEAVVTGLIDSCRYLITVTDVSQGTVDNLRHLAGVKSVAMVPANGRRNVSLDLKVTEPELHVPLILERLSQAGVKVIEVARAGDSLGDAIAALGDESS